MTKNSLISSLESKVIEISENEVRNSNDGGSNNKRDIWNFS